MNKRTFFASALALVIAMAALASCASMGSGASAREYDTYTLYVSGYIYDYSSGHAPIQGIITAVKDAEGKITIIPELVGGNLGFTLTHDMCPLVPAGKESVLHSPFSISRFCREIVIDGNTTTNTKIYGSGQNVVVSEEKEVVDGNTTIYSNSLVSGLSSKTVVEGNTETFTYLGDNDFMSKTVTVVNGNTTTRVGSTYEKGKLSSQGQTTDKLIVSGNTTTIERDGFIYHEKTVDGNTTTIIYIYRGLGYRAEKTVIDKKGSNIYIRLDTDESLRASGQEYLEQGDYDRAIADFTLLLRTQPPDNHAAWLYFNRGLAYVRKNDYDRAISDCTQAIKLDPNNSWAYNNRGSAFLGKGDRARARADWIKALQLDPSNAVARDNLERFR